MRNPDPISRLADETGDSIAEHSDDESMTNAPDTPDVGNVSTSNIRGGLGREWYGSEWGRDGSLSSDWGFI